MSSKQSTDIEFPGEEPGEKVQLVFRKRRHLSTFVVPSKYFCWHHTYYVVTDRRIRQQLQLGLFKKSVTDIDLYRVESVTFKTDGIKGGLTGTGTITMSTMTGDLTMFDIPHVAEVYNELSNLVRKAGGVTGSGFLDGADNSGSGSSVGDTDDRYSDENISIEMR